MISINQRVETLHQALAELAMIGSKAMTVPGKLMQCIIPSYSKNRRMHRGQLTRGMLLTDFFNMHLVLTDGFLSLLGLRALVK